MRVPSAPPGPAPSRRALVFSADRDEGYACGLAVAVTSALRRLERDNDLDVYVLDNGLSPSAKRRLQRIVDRARSGQRVDLLEVPDRLQQQVAPGARFPASSYARLLLPDLLPPTVRRVVYLDADVLVRKDFSPLFELDLGGLAVGAVRDFSVESTAHDLSGVREREPARPYFNGGVLVIDVPAWTRADVGQRALAYAFAGDSPLRQGDQDALNAVIDAWHPLPDDWNVQHALNLPRPVYGDAAILHFIGGKPWNPLCRTPGTFEWVQSLIRSGWFGPGESVLWLLRWFSGRYVLNSPQRRRWVEMLLRTRWAARLRSAARRMG